MLGAFSSVSADYVPDVSVSVDANMGRIYVDKYSSGTIPYDFKFTVPNSALVNLKPYYVYQISTGPTINSVFKKENGTQGSPTNLRRYQSTVVNGSSSSYSMINTFSATNSSYGASVFFYLTDEQIEYFKSSGDVQRFSVFGTATFSWQSSPSDGYRYAEVWGSWPTSVQMWSTNVLVPAGTGSDGIKEAIENQTSDINQNHQETMDKIDDITDFDEQEQSGMTGQVDDVKGQLDEKLGILSFADTVIGNFIDLFKETSEKPGLAFPGFEIEVDGVSYTVWDDTIFDLSTIDTGFSDLMSVVRFATSFLVYAALFMYVQKIFSAIMQDWSDRNG